MKKTKIIGLAAATLLAVAPIISTSVVSAADTTQTNSSTTSNDKVNSQNPVITYDGQTFDSDQNISDIAEKTSLSYIPLRGNLSTLVDNIRKDFSATASASDKTPVDIKINFAENTSTFIASKSQASVSATNSKGVTTTLTFDLIIGDKNSNAQYAIARPKVRGHVNLFRIRDGKVSNSYGDILLNDGTNVATFGTETINGVSYTRLNGPDSDMFVETNSVDGTYPLDINAQPKTVTKTLMHTAIAYDGDGHKTNKKYYAYRQLDLNTIKANLKGSMFYNVSGTSDYIKVGNIDGTKRTLKKNAYIYATSKRRADRTLLRKGQTITTYGGSYKFKNGKRYYRIEGSTATNKRYVRVVNFE